MKSVALPVIYGTNRIHVDRGVRWTAIEHSLLWLTCQSSISAREASQKSALPYRLVVEILSRLMRAGWVNAHESSKGVSFSATEQGLSVVDRPELPRIPKPSDRIAKFVLELFNGDCFKNSDFSRIVTQNRLDELKQKEEIVVIPKPIHEYHSDPSKIIETLLQDGETFIRYGDDPPRLSDRYALLRVNNATIHGIPGNASETLKKAIFYYAANTETSQDLANSTLYNEDIVHDNEINFKNARLDVDDALIFGGPAHLKAIKEALQRAEEIVVIHSTFISLKTFELLYDDFYSAYERGVKVQILWGQGEQGERRGTTSEAVRKCENYLRDRSHGASILSFEYFSTGSHSKIIAYDLRSSYMACVIGSCNWLSSSYDSLECSIRVRDPVLVVPILKYLTELARPTPGGTTPIVGTLVKKIMLLQGASYNQGNKVSASVIHGGEHNLAINLARDTSQRNIHVFSHRVGDGADNLILSPFTEASNQRGVQVKIHYTKDDRSDFAIQQQDLSTLNFTQSIDPRLHAKCLIWDCTYALITSQNLCSADPPDHARLSELGLLIESPLLARKISSAFNDALDQTV
jgi:cardiolipin synthase